MNPARHITLASLMILVLLASGTFAPRPRVVRDTMRETLVVILFRSGGYA